MAGQPFYHLRPNKYIDRNLFLQTLIGLNSAIGLSDYCYTGFGSYLFDDFKMVHETLGITHMTSLEIENAAYKRACFNRPYSCIDIKNISSTDYLSELVIPEDSHNIFWLDYVSPSELGLQLADYVTLLNLLNPMDVVRITLNAAPEALGHKNASPEEQHQLRFEELCKRVPNQYLRSDINADSVVSKKYPQTLLSIIKAATLEALSDNPPYSPNFLFPLFSTSYADGQQMVTFTGIVLDSHEKEAIIRHALKDYPHNTMQWDALCNIAVPPLSIREIIEINKLLPCDDYRQQLENLFDRSLSQKEFGEYEEYRKYYKYYPNYHHISF